MFAVFNRFEIQMTLREAESVSHYGDCEVDVLILLESPKIKRQFKKIDPKKIREELKEYGACSESELQDESENQKRILWIAGCNIAEEYTMRNKNEQIYTLYECGICASLHRWNFQGDCREDKNRFSDEHDFAKRMHVRQDQIELRSMADRIEADETQSQ